MCTIVLGIPVLQWTHMFIIYILLFVICSPSSSASKADVAKHQPVHNCTYPDSPDPEQHEKFLNVLNGTSVVFVGDSVTRCRLCVHVQGMCTSHAGAGGWQPRVVHVRESVLHSVCGAGDSKRLVHLDTHQGVRPHSGTVRDMLAFLESFSSAGSST